jgi:flagellar biogenesis protein FliO
MRIRNKWLLIPPAAALLLFLGPLRPDTTKGTTPAETPTAPASTPGVTIPRTPDLWQVGSTLIGVLLLGGAGVFLFARMRQRPRGQGGQVFTVRQTQRLSAKQQLIAVEFDEQMLLLGEHEGRLSVLCQGRLQEPAADEAQVRARTAVIEDEADEGAVPKNLVLPRPERPAPPVPATQQRQQPQTLSSFRSLLQKAGRA